MFLYINLISGNTNQHIFKFIKEYIPHTKYQTKQEHSHTIQRHSKSLPNSSSFLKKTLKYIYIYILRVYVKKSK